MRVLTLQSGIINFRGDIGYSDIFIKVNGKPHMKIIIEVVVKRNKIVEIPSDSEEDYYVFKIEKWKRLDRKIEVKGYQVVRVMYTTEYLLSIFVAKQDNRHLK
ncbi:hypothetical protein [Clostridium sp.]|uniref:hypothetical protein n=1 Tax=Clostridium sp. TaxID=1506 RepID=UPI003D6C78E6